MFDSDKNLGLNTNQDLDIKNSLIQALRDNTNAVR